MKPGSSKSSASVRLIAGWCGLLFYLGAFSPLGVVAAGLLGTIDPDHRAIFRVGTNGASLVLHHEGNCAAHQHHGLARALTIFAQPASATDPDHVVQFASGNGLCGESLGIVSIGDGNEEHHFAHTALLFGQSSRIESERPAIGPPPDIVGNLLNVRFTVLLI